MTRDEGRERACERGREKENHSFHSTVGLEVPGLWTDPSRGSWVLNVKPCSELSKNRIGPEWLMTGGPKTQTPDCKCYLASAFQHNPFPHNDRFLPIQGQLAYPDTPAFWRRFRPLDGESRPLFTHGIAGLSCQILPHDLIPIRGEKNNMESRAYIFPPRLLFFLISGSCALYCGLLQKTSAFWPWQIWCGWYRGDVCACVFWERGREKLKALQSDDKIINGAGCIVSPCMHIHKEAVQMA